MGSRDHFFIILLLINFVRECPYLVWLLLLTIIPLGSNVYDFAI